MKKTKKWDGTISDEQMLRLKAARHKHADEVLERVMQHQPLMPQLRESIAEIELATPAPPAPRLKQRRHAVASSGLDYILLAPARRFFSGLVLAEQAEVVGLLADIYLDPFVDGVRKSCSRRRYSSLRSMTIAGGLFSTGSSTMT